LKFIQGNNGQAYCFSDLNMFDGQRAYFMTNTPSTPIALDVIYMDIMENYTHSPVAPTYLTNIIYEYEDAEEIKERFRTDYYWLFGSIDTGGLAFGFTQTTHHLIMIQWALTAYNSSEIWVTDKCYIFDHVYTGGQEYDRYQAIIVPDGSGDYVDMFSVGCGYLTPLGVPEYVTGYVSNLDVQTTWDYLAYHTPSGINVNPGDTDGITITVGQTDYGLRVSPYLTDLNGLSAYNGWHDNVEPYDPTQDDDPNKDMPQSSDGGGGGVVVPSVPVPVAENPPDVLINSGVIKMYMPTTSEMNSFINYIYSSPVAVIDNFKKLWQNPMDSIISFGVVPFTPPYTEHEEVKFCGVSSGVTMAKISSQYMKKNFGIKHLTGENNSYLDYNSFTKVKLFLPFFGFVDLNTDDVMDADVNIQYNIDLLTGECIAFVHCSKTNTDLKINLEAVCYEFKGNVLSSAPLTGNNYQQLYSGVVNMVKAVALPSAGTALSVIDSTLSQKVTVERGGSLTGNGGSLGEYTPYFLLERPINAIPGKGAKLIGVPHYKTFELSALSGYTEIDIDSFRVTDIPNISEDEANELLQILEGGFVL
jgi:hypothetical protein